MVRRWEHCSAWRASSCPPSSTSASAGLPVETGLDPQRQTCETNDVWYKPYEHREAVEQAMRDYLSWEINLVEQIERDGDAQFS